MLMLDIIGTIEQIEQIKIGSYPAKTFVNLFSWILRLILKLSVVFIWNWIFNLKRT